MKPSVYNLSFEHNGAYYLYNILSTAMAEVPEQFLRILESGSLSELDEDTVNAMKEAHFIVEDDADEALEYLYYYDSSRFHLTSESFNLTLIPTYGCNLCCPYCYQGAKKEYEVITHNQLMIISRFVESEIERLREKSSIKRLNITLFGGEPLIAKEALLDFCVKMDEIANSYHCKPSFFMVSNFTLVDDDVIEMMRRFNMDVQVTIDGGRDFHNSRRVRKDGSGTFDCILNNIKKCYERGLKDHIQVRINVDEKNIDTVDDVFKLVQPYVRTIYLAFLESFEGRNDSFKSCFHETGYSRMVVDKIAPISKQNGFPIMRPFGKRSPCYFNQENAFFVDSKLDVYKCDLMIGYPKGKSGRIDNNGTFIPSSTYYKQMNYTPGNFSVCRNCTLLPVCGGGCPAREYVRNKRCDGSFHNNCEVTKEGLILLLRGYIDGLYE